MNYKECMQQGIYCKRCGSFTNREPGHPIFCEFCEEVAEREAKGPFDKMEDFHDIKGFYKKGEQ